jgi:hypothetical protein
MSAEVGPDHEVTFDFGAGAVAVRRRQLLAVR